MESLLLAAMGGAGGIVIAFGLAELFRGQRLIRLPAFEGLAPDARLLAFAVGAALVAGLLAGVIPSLLGGRVDLSENLKEASGRKTAGSTAARSLMTIVQVALSLALLVGALLLTRTIRNLYAVDLGIDPSNVHTFWVNAMPPGYSAAESDEMIRSLHRELRTVAGVEGVAIDLYGPFGSAFLGALQPPGDGEPVRVINRFASPGYFEVLGIPIVEGRSFRDEDWSAAGSESVIVTRSLARRIFGEAGVVGRTVTTTARQPETFTVIGVTADLHLQTPVGEPDAAIWRVLSALPFPAVSVMVKTRSPGAALTDAIREAIFSVMPDVPIADPVPLRQQLDARVGEQRLFARLLAVLSALAVFLAAIGLYGVIAWTVTERTREIGIRMALGARLQNVTRLVVTRVALLVVPGIALGLAGAVAIARLVRHQLFGVTPLDAHTYIQAGGLFLAVAVVACLAPTRAATRVDPVRALRTD